MRSFRGILGAIVGLLFGVFGPAGMVENARAADQAIVPVSEAPPVGFTFPKLSLTGSWQFPWTDNALTSPTDRRHAFYMNPDFTLALSGNLSDAWSYKLYARALVDVFHRESDANDSVSLVGARVGREFWTWTVLASYENREYYNSVFDVVAFFTHDFKVLATRDFVWNTVTFSPTGAFTYRYSDTAAANKYWVTLGLDVEVPIAERTSIVGGPGFVSTWFTAGANAGREDQLYSGSIGIKYVLAKDLSVTTSISYEKRASNFAFARYEKFDIGPKLDFKF